MHSSHSTTTFKCPIFLWDASGADRSPLPAEDLVRLGRDSSISPIRLFFTATSDADSDGHVVEFEKNRDLLGENLLTASTSTSSPGLKSLCHYETIGDGGGNGHSALSICSMEEITGLLRFHGSPYALVHNPVEGLYLISHDGARRDKCDWNMQRGKRAKRAAGGSKSASGLPSYYEDYVQDGLRRYVELALIADHSIYKKYGEDEKRVHDRLESISNVVNSLYSPLNIRVTLVWADIWKERDAVEVSSQADKTLANFLAYRKGVLDAHPHDNAHLLTNIEFGTVIGKAYKGTMCSYDYSGGVIVDHSESAVYVARTVTHEMGHNFGMDHDVGYPEPCKCGAESCIMSPASISGANFTAYFSDCSLDNLDHALRRNVDYCLRNVPKSAFGGAKCGNGILEEGEECDCGSTDTCPNHCCIASKCRLAQEAKCAEGECCDTKTCKPKAMATPCRDAVGSCDLTEYCDGANPVCPPDFFVQNGLACPNHPDASCYEGECGSRDQQCQLIWGPSGHSSVAECYAFNQYASMSGNCGYDPKTDRYKACQQPNYFCGRLQCEHESDKPLFGDPATVYTASNSIRLRDGKEAKCRVIRTTLTGSGRKGQPDPGMVPDGANCGPGRMCVGAECRNSSELLEMVSKCEPANCNNKGICNNVGNCHCEVNYGGIACDIPGYGGSVNSGPASDHVFNPSMALLYVLIALFALFVAATFYCKRKKNYWLHKELWKGMRQVLNIETIVRVPVRKAPPPPPSRTTIQHTHRRDSFNAAWGDIPAAISNGHAKAKSVLRIGTKQAYVPQPIITFNKTASHISAVPASTYAFTKTDLHGATSSASSSSSDERASPPQPPPHRSLLGGKHNRQTVAALPPSRKKYEHPPEERPKPTPPSKPPVVSPKPKSFNAGGPDDPKPSVRELAAKFDR